MIGSVREGACSPHQRSPMILKPSVKFEGVVRDHFSRGVRGEDRGHPGSEVIGTFFFTMTNCGMGRAISESGIFCSAIDWRRHQRHAMRLSRP